MFHCFMMGLMGFMGSMGIHRGSKLALPLLLTLGIAHASMALLSINRRILHSSFITILPSILASMIRCLMMLSIITSRVFRPIS